MKEKKQQESQRLKALREKDNDKSDDRRRKLSQEKVLKIFFIRHPEKLVFETFRKLYFPLET